APAGPCGGGRGVPLVSRPRWVEVSQHMLQIRCIGGAASGDTITHLFKPAAHYLKDFLLLLFREVAECFTQNLSQGVAAVVDLVRPSFQFGVRSHCRLLFVGIVRRPRRTATSSLPRPPPPAAVRGAQPVSGSLPLREGHLG